MNPILQQLLSMGPGIGAAIGGDGRGMAAFMEGYQRTLAQLEQQKRLKQQNDFALQDRATAAADRERLIARQNAADQYALEDRNRAAELGRQQDYARSLTASNAITQQAANLGDPAQAKAYIESMMPTLLSTFGQNAMALGQPMVEQAQQVITGRQKKQVEDFLGKWEKTDMAVHAKDTDPLLTALPDHIAKLVGKPEARLSELQKFAQLPVGLPERKPSDSVSFDIKEGIGPDGKPGFVGINPKTLETKPVTGVTPKPEKPNAGDEPIAPDDVQGAASAILSGRMAPSQLSLVGGMGNRGVKFKQAVVSEVNKQNPGFNWQQAEAGYQYGKAPGTQTTVRYLDNVAKTIPMLRQANQTFKRSNVRFVNDVIKSGKSQFGDVNVADFDFKSTLLADEIAKVLQGGGTGSGTSDAKLRQAQELLNGNLTPQQFETVLNAAEDMLKVRRQSLTNGTFMDQPEQPGAKFKIGQTIRNKKTGELGEVTGIRPDGSPIVRPK